MKNILHVVNVAFALPHFLGEQFDYFKSNGFKIHLICSPSKDFDSFVLERNLEKDSYSVPVLRKIAPFQDLISILKISLYIKKHKIDTVIGHSPKGGLLSMISAYVLRVPNRIFFRHGLVYETAHGIKRKVLIYIERLTSFCATQVVCVSPSIQEVSNKDRLDNPQKQRLLGKGTCAGIDTMSKFNQSKIDLYKKKELGETLNITSHKLVLGFCGRLAVDKGIIELIDAFDLLDREFPDQYMLLLIGDMDQRDPLPKEIVNKISLNKSIVITGLIKSDIQYYYSQIDIFILPSYREGFPISTLEASSMAIPVLTTKVTGCVDSIVDNLTGFYITHESEDIKSKIVMLSSESVRLKMGNAGRDFVVKNFDNKIIWKELKKIL